MKSISRAFFCLYDFVVFYCGVLAFGLLALSWTLAAVVLYPVLPRATGRRVGRAAIMLAFRGFLAFLQMSGRFRFELDALDALKHENSLIIAPNHPSLWDAVLVVSRLPDVACVMKAEVINNLFLGAGARLARYIRNGSLRQMINLAVAELKRGDRILLFPEGTRTVRPPVNPLTGGIGVIACRSGAAVQTVIIETDSPFLTKGWAVWKKPPLPMHYRVRLGQRFEAGADSAAMVSQLEQYFMGQTIECAGIPSPQAPLTEPPVETAVEVLPEVRHS
jgi:1-acyl-sn-glycerol-3-phosphate acyltransferase